MGAMIKGAHFAHLSRVLSQLRHDVSGNAIMLVAGAAVPLLVGVGGAIDMGRMYATGTKLQSACDAAVLGGRLSMDGNAWTAHDKNVADNFFHNNFPSGKYGSSGETISYRKANSGELTGTATATLPMTIMGIFGLGDKDYTLTCKAQKQVGNTDVMFVLDTTGSMAGTDGDDVPRIDEMRAAVTSFHGTLNTASQAGALVRYGFVPYSSAVNVGYSLDSDWLVDDWTYQSRQQIADNSNGKGNNPKWAYEEVEFDVSSLKNQSSGATLTVPIGDDFTNKTLTWDGCIEERDTVQADDYSTLPAGALDLDIDLVPTAGEPATQWRPHLPDLVYARPDFNDPKPGRVVSTENTTNLGDLPNGWAACPAAAQRLQTMSGSDVETYLATLNPNGGTYHDIGLIWGARMLSPTGLFAADNAMGANGEPITRHLVFMTDGQTDTSPWVYDAYGWPVLDRRRNVGNNKNNTPTKAEQDAEIESRMAAVCSQARAKNITLWVVAFGTNLSSNLQNCAGADHAFEADSQAELTATFNNIASQISNLRLTN